MACETQGDKHLIQIVDTVTERILSQLHGHTDTITHVVWSADESLLASASHDKSVRVWDGAGAAILQPRLVSVCAHPSAVTCVVMIDKQYMLTGAEDGCLRVWQLNDKT